MRAACIGVLGALPFVAAPAAAHTLGISSSELSVAANGEVRARFVFASRDVATVVHLDPNDDGIVSEAEVARAQQELSAFVADGVELTTASGETCAGRAPVSSLDESDGLAFEGTYACGSGAGSVTATLYFLGHLAPGHRHLASIVAGDASTQRLLTATNRAISLPLPAVPEGSWLGDAGGGFRKFFVRDSWSIAACAAGLGAVIVAVAAIVTLRRRRHRVPHISVTITAPHAGRSEAVAESRRDP